VLGLTKNRFPQIYLLAKIYAREKNEKKRGDKYPTAPEKNRKKRRGPDLGKLT
jgi:hypothetical protein